MGAIDYTGTLITQKEPSEQFQELVHDNIILLEQKTALRQENDRLAQQLFQSMSELAEERRERDRLNDQAFKQSIEFQNTKMKLDTSNQHLFKMLDEKEGEFENNEKFASPEICQDYIDAALYCQKYFGRDNNRVRQAQEWYDELKPWEQTDKLRTEQD